MPDSDALIIGAYSRYMDSIAIVLYGIMLMIGCTAALPMIKPESICCLKKPDYSSDGVYRKLVVIQKQYQLLEKDAKILVYTHTPYAGFYVTYCFRSIDAWAIDAASFSRAMDETPEYYDYLIVIDHDEYIDTELEKNSMPTDETMYFL